MSIGPRSPAQEPRPPRHSEGLPTRWRNKILNLVEVVVILAILSFLIGLLGEFHFLFDLASHFRVQAGIVAVIGGMILGLFRDFKTGALSLAAGTALLLSTYPYFLPTAAPSAESARRRLIIMNVLKENQQKQAVIDFLRSQDPDVIVLFETDQAWEAALTPALTDNWPHQKIIPLQNHYGICLYSKLDWVTAQQLDLTEFQIPAIDVQFERPSWRLIGTHTIAPVGSRAWRARNLQFDAVAELVKERHAGRTVFVGDLNCTPWAPSMREFVKRSGLHDASYGQKLKSTWFIAPIRLAGLPIDHVLIGPEIGVASHQVGPPLGSDHRPITVDLTFRQPDEARNEKRAPNR